MGQANHTEDYRIVSARQLLTESRAAQAPDSNDDRPAMFWWGQIECSLELVLQAVDEAAQTVRTPDLEDMTKDQMIVEAERMLDELQSFIARLRARKS